MTDCVQVVQRTTFCCADMPFHMWVESAGALTYVAQDRDVGLSCRPP